MSRTALEAPQRVALFDDERSLSSGGSTTGSIASPPRCNATASARARRSRSARSVRVEYVATFLGALRAGVVVAPLAPLDAAKSLADMARDCGARLLVPRRDDAAAVSEVEARVARIALDEQAGARFPGLAGAPGAAPAPVAVEPDWVFNTIYSSGTTGAPKGIDQSHGMRFAHIHRARCSATTPNAVTLVSTPLYSNTTLVSVFPALAGGGRVVLMTKVRRAALPGDRRGRARHPRHAGARAIPPHDGAARFRPLRSLQLPDEILHQRALRRRAQSATCCDRWPGGLVEYYGMTEGGGTCILAAHRVSRQAAHRRPARRGPRHPARSTRRAAKSARARSARSSAARPR